MDMAPEKLHGLSLQFRSSPRIYIRWGLDVGHVSLADERILDIRDPSFVFLALDTQDVKFRTLSVRHLQRQSWEYVSIDQIKYLTSLKYIEQCQDVFWSHKSMHINSDRIDNRYISSLCFLFNI